ncbi:MAG: S9 family peptidase [Chitinophagaceae bacterium]|nr:MAG: S9 family peptidase [Chitinophagaceae bacterium]
MVLISCRFCLVWLMLFICSSITIFGQGKMKWASSGDAYYTIESGEIVLYQLPAQTRTIVVAKDKLKPAGESKTIIPASFAFSTLNDKVLIFTNTKKVWRLNTRGDYWVFDIKLNTLKKLGAGKAPSSLMFAKFSPDGKTVAYVSDYNIYSEDLATGKIKQLTSDGNRKLINGTFDWVYEEEFYCRDGFRWSPDSRSIAFWQINAKGTRDYLMVNNTDSLYPFAVPVEYPISGEPPSPSKIGVIDIAGGDIKWMNLPSDPELGSYLPRMEWAGNNLELIIQHLSRRQNESALLICNISTGKPTVIYTEKDAAWIDVLQTWDSDYIWGGWDWLNKGKEFLWASEKDGWRHLYRVSRDGRREIPVTKGNFDVIDIAGINEKSGFVYFLASPENATQSYLFRTRLDGKGPVQRISPLNQTGTHNYDMSPGAVFAMHNFSNHYTAGVREIISVGDHKGINSEDKVNQALNKTDSTKARTEFFKVKTQDGVEMDGWMVKPLNFDSTKKYPVVFYVYTEPAGQNVRDVFGAGNNWLYKGDMAADGYIYISIDNRGTPVPKGSRWRKSVYRKVGRLNISDQASAAREVLKWKFADTSRVAVWGWSGGGSATLNLMFQYPEIYKTGIAIAAVADQRTYDNIYQERYMGIPQENAADFKAGSPLTHASKLRGNLLYIHGTGDDNVHYNNAEMLINELIKHNRQFQLMAYPNRTHSISEGAGTGAHLSTLYTEYLRKNCAPGAR